MKTTLKIPDHIFRRPKARAAQEGVPLRQFVSAAVNEKLRGSRGAGEKPWMKLAGGLRHLRKESTRIRRRMVEEFEGIEPEDRGDRPSLRARVGYFRSSRPLHVR